MVVVQFESAEAIDRAEEILAVDGVDMALFGTNDLTADMGIPGDYENPQGARRLRARHRGSEEARQARRRRRARRRSPKLTAEFVKMGARYVSTGTDLGFLLDAATAQAKQVRAWRHSSALILRAARRPRLEGSAYAGVSAILRGSLRSHLRMRTWSCGAPADARWHAPCIFAKLSASHHPKEDLMHKLLLTAAAAVHRRTRLPPLPPPRRRWRRSSSAACSSSAARPTTSRSASAIRRGAIVGFEPDIAKLVADKLGVKLELEPVVSSNRMQFLQQGKIDLMIATMNDKPDRRQVVGIIEPLYYASGVNVLANKKAGAEDLGAAQGPEGLRHPGRLVQQAGRREVRRRHRRLQGPDRGRGRAAAGQLHRLGL